MRNYEDKPIIIYDGVCNLCNRFVTFVMRRDKGRQFLFSGSDSKTALYLIYNLNIAAPPAQTVILVKRDKIYTHSSAVLEILKDLDSPLRHLYIFRHIPKLVRDFVYKLVAKVRYRVFGRDGYCAMDAGDMRDRFLD